MTTDATWPQRRELPDLAPTALLHAWKVTRDCQGAPCCREVELKSCERLDPDDVLPWSMRLGLYLERGTSVGPAFTEVVCEGPNHSGSGR